MIRNIKHIIATALLAMTSAVSAWAQPSGGGTGTSDDPYLIATATDLKAFADYVNASHWTACARLTADIDLSSVCSETLGNWTPIGHDYSNSYRGTFDGQNHTISGLYYHNDAECDHIGFFGYIGSGSTVGHVSFDGVDIVVPQGSYVGALSGDVQTSRFQPLEHINVLGGTITGRSYVGGVGGRMQNGVYNYLSNAATINADYSIGGIAGEISSGNATLTGAINTGNVNASTTFSGDTSAGGIVGIAYAATLNRCINDADVIGHDKVAGIVGYFGSNAVRIYDCANVGNITATTAAAGIAAFTNTVDCEVARCYNRGNITITSNSYGYTSNYYGAGSIIGYYSISNAIPSFTDCYIDPASRIIDKEGSHAPVGLGYQDHANFQGTVAGITVAESAALESGAIAFSFQAGRTDATYWSQHIGVDHWPMPNYDGSLDMRVYADGTIHCSGELDGQYTNTPSTPVVDPHHFTDGICTACGTYEEPTLDGDYYLIANVGHLLWFRDEVNLGHRTGLRARQTIDLDLSSVCGEGIGNWIPIGATNLTNEGFHACQYDGQGHTISDLYIDDTATTQKNQGLFGLVDSSRLKNIVLSNVHINLPQSESVGAIIGKYQGVDNPMADCRVLSGTIKGKKYVGGFVGYSLISVTNGLNQANVVAVEDCAGGIVGYSSSNRALTSCHNKGNVTATNQCAGGIIGRMDNVTVRKCQVNANVTADTYAGGIVGGITSTGSTIEDCAVYGTITADYAAGICQNAVNNTVTHCFVDATVNNTNSRGECGLIVGDNYSKVTDCYYAASSKMYHNGEEVAPAATYMLPTDPAGMQRATAADIASGAIAYRLQGLRTGSPVWGQNIDQSADPDPMPILNIGTTAAPRVYMKSGTDNCAGEVVEAATYSNTEAGSTATHLGHTFDAQLYCTTCHSGTEPAQTDGVYQVATYGELVWVRDHVNTNRGTTHKVALTADIDMTPYVGADKASFVSFIDYKGEFDGAGHAIRGYYADFDKLALPVQYRGLFSNQNSSLYNIHDLELEGTALTTGSHIALLAGWAGNDASRITNCITRGSVTGDQNVAGVVEYLNGFATATGCINYATINGGSNNAAGICAIGYGRIDYCTNYGAISGSQRVAGICASYSSEASNLANYGTVTCSGAHAGGIFAYNEGSGKYHSDLANYGHVQGHNIHVGGIAGYSGANYYDRAFNGGDVTLHAPSNSYSYIFGPIFGYHAQISYQSNLYYAADIRLTKGTAAVDPATADDYANTCVSAEELATGATTYALGDKWGQRLGHDPYPILGSKATVYCGTHRHAVSTPVSATPVYSNDIMTDSYEDHNFRNGFCTICGKNDGNRYDTSALTLIDWVSDNQGIDSTESKKEYPFTAQEGTELQFDWTVDSEENFDKFYAELINVDASSIVKCFVNGVSGTNKAGNVAITFSTADAIYKPGNYKLRLRYYKDSSSKQGTDTATATGSIGRATIVGIYGDVDGNGTFDLDDVNAIREMVLHPTTAHTNADLNEDGDVTIGDVTEAIHQLIMP